MPQLFAPKLFPLPLTHSFARLGQILSNRFLFKEDVKEHKSRGKKMEVEALSSIFRIFTSLDKSGISFCQSTAGVCLCVRVGSKRKIKFCVCLLESSEVYQSSNIRIVY